MHQFEFNALMKATWETIYIVYWSSLFSIIFGLLFGILLFYTSQNGPWKNKFINRLVNLIINMTRSIPFLILMISILPLTRFLTGTTIGSQAAIVPLTLAAIPFFARVCENSFAQVPHALLETGTALGLSHKQLLTYILIPESFPSLVRGITLTVITLIGYSAMAGAIGGGGLGELAINFGYQRFEPLVTLETVIVLILLVQLIQYFGDKLAKRYQLKPFILGVISIGLACLVIDFYPTTLAETNRMKVGITAGWNEEVMALAQKIAQEKYHLRLDIVTFNDYIMPNTALAEGNIDANIFQHLPYLNAQNKNYQNQLIPLAKTFVYPLGFYSRKLTQLNQLKNKAIIAIPNDPSNQARALLLLAKLKLITLTSNHPTVSVNEISENPKQLQFKLIDAAQLPRILSDADLVALTNDYVKNAGFKINQAIIKEDKDSLYANIIVIHQSSQDQTKFRYLVEIMHSSPIVDKTTELLSKEGAIPAW